MHLVRAALILLAACMPASVLAQQAPPGRVYTSDLVTRWGKQVTPANAWRSYPRPQMKRDEWLNLNGHWDYAIRPKAEARPARMDGRILVPFAVESRLSGVARAVTPNDRLWYRRTFAVPAGWRGQRVLLHFGAVDFEAHVLVNGGTVGSHRGGSDTFSFDVTDYLRSGENELVVHVTDPTSSGAQPRGKQQLEPEGIWYTPVSGIWQTVWLEPVPALRIEDVRLTPDIDRGELKVEVALNRSAADTDAVRITARDGRRTVSSVLVRGNRPATLPVPNARLWSPETPFLYDLDIELVKVRSPFPPEIKDRGALILTEREAELYARTSITGAISRS